LAPFVLGEGGTYSNKVNYDQYEALHGGKGLSIFTLPSLSIEGPDNLYKLWKKYYAKQGLHKFTWYLIIWLFLINTFAGQHELAG